MLMIPNKLTILLCVLQVVFILLFALFVRYDDSANASVKANSLDEAHGGAVGGENQLSAYYAMFQDVHVMIFIGFGFLMTFLKKYGYGSIGFNLLLGALVIQWATLTEGFLFNMSEGVIRVSITSMFTADFAIAAVLISFGAVLGKTSLIQLVVMAIIEIVLYQINVWLGYNYFKAVDVGGSMFIHAFGAYFGLALASVLYSDDLEKASSKEGSVYHSDLFSMVGTVFLWIFWPSFNGGVAAGDDQHRAVLNTYFSLAASVVITVAISSFVNKDRKLDMVHIQNATLAGGVAVGTTADLMIQPWGALLLGSIAGLISTLGYAYITPWLVSKLKIHDTCGVNNLHGMPGVIGAIGGVAAAAFASEAQYGYSLYQIFPARSPLANSTELFDIQLDLAGVEGGQARTAGGQALYQLAALGATLAIAIVGGFLTGKLLQMEVCETPAKRQIFDDGDYWLLPEDGVPEVAVESEIVTGIQTEAENQL